MEEAAVATDRGLTHADELGVDETMVDYVKVAAASAHAAAADRRVQEDEDEVVSHYSADTDMITLQPDDPVKTRLHEASHRDEAMRERPLSDYLDMGGEPLPANPSKAWKLFQTIAKEALHVRVGYVAQTLVEFDDAVAVAGDDPAVRASFVAAYSEKLSNDAINRVVAAALEGLLSRLEGELVAEGYQGRSLVEPIREAVASGKPLKARLLNRVLWEVSD